MDSNCGLSQCNKKIDYAQSHELDPDYVLGCEPENSLADGNAMESSNNEQLVSTTRLRALRSAMGTGEKPLLIAIHDYPDPDAIAAAMAMQTLAGSWGISSVIAHGGVLGREENAEMVRLLKIELKTFRTLKSLDAFRGVVFLDTQPMAKNQSLPLGIPVLAVVDHHSLGDDSVRYTERSSRGTTKLVYSDVRLSVGASSTLMVGYLEAAGIVPDKRLATALFLGIKTDTDGLLRVSGPDDVHAYTSMMQLADLTIASQAIHPPLDISFFQFLHVAVSGAGIYGATVITNCGDIKSPDMLSTASDFLIPLRDMRYALAVGFHEGRAFLSLRAKAPHADATRVLLRVVEPEGKGGGHNLSAGGSIKLDMPPEQCFELIRTRLLEATGDNGNSRKDIIA